MPTQKISKKLEFLEARVLRTIREHGMIRPGDRVLAAVSGGADSMALLLCLYSLKPILRFELDVAHLNHSLRGRESDGDEDFVRRAAEERGLAFYSEVIDVRGCAESKKRNLEQTAREERYAFLRRTARNSGANRVAVGHNQDDQAETVLFRLLRGSGVEGLSSIHPVVGRHLVRPLLDCSRQLILQYLERRQCAYREDSSNRDLTYSRNRIRLELIPYLQRHFNPGFVETVAGEAATMRETWDLLHALAEKSCDTVTRPVEGGIALSTAAVKALHPALQKEVLRCALRNVRGDLKGIGRVHIEQVLQLCRSTRGGGQVRLPQEMSAIRQFDDLLLLCPQPETTPGYRHELQVPGHCLVPEARAQIRAEIASGPLRPRDGEHRSRAYLDPSALHAPLIIRSRLPGDRYGGGTHRKVKKMLIDGKIPAHERICLPMVVSEGSVIWIPGFRPAKAYAAEKSSQTVVILTYIKD
jgi:tRNA(Ile)-lysidine synthase